MHHIGLFLKCFFNQRKTDEMSFFVSFVCLLSLLSHVIHSKCIEQNANLLSAIEKQMHINVFCPLSHEKHTYIQTGRLFISFSDDLLHLLIDLCFFSLV